MTTDPGRGPRDFANRAMAGLGAAVLLVPAILLAALSQEKASPPDAVLASPTLPARGRQETRLTVSRFGRYSITASSRQGVAIQLVDRMAGPGQIAGSPGQSDGRLDLFLDRGEFKIVALASGKGAGDARLAVRPFAERNPSPAPVLVELKPMESSLGDLEQVSYWLPVAETRTVVLEAAGRNLADLRLWKDGAWLVDAEPETQVVTPVTGHPLRDCRLAANLAPGLYRLTAYGGPSQDWAEDSPEHPLHLRFGVPRLPETQRQRFLVSPFGADRWLVSGRANYFRMEIPEARPAAMRVGWFDPDKPFENAGDLLEIRKESLPPVAQEEAESDAEKTHVVTISGDAGQPYVLQNFEAKPYYEIRASGPYWVSTVSSGDPADSADSTGILTQQIPSAAHAEPLRTQVIELDSKSGWARRCNLLGTLEIFLEIREAGSYEVLSSGVEARFRIEPFLTYRPENYRSPDFQGAGSKWDLDRGYAVLTVEPVKKGVLDLAVRPSGLADFVPKDQEPPRPLLASVTFPEVALSEESLYTLYVNQRPEIRTGLVLRALPVDLGESLPLAPPGGETVSVPVTVPEEGEILCETDDGRPLEISVDGGPWKRGRLAVEAGRHAVSVRNGGKKTSFAALSLEPRRLSAAAALPPLPETALASLPEFPVLEDKQERTFDLESKGSATFLVRADAPALYRLQTTGLLSTEGNLRTRTLTSFQRETANGVGRNFLIQNYLREGDYQVTVAAQGASQGHLGLTLERTPLLDGGKLGNGIPARLLLPAGHAVAYRFDVARRGEYRLRAIGLGHTFRCRLEDLDGWPLDRPDLPADITRVFEPGSYRLLVLPEAVDNRVLTLLSRTPSPRRDAGHGPHPLPLARAVEHQWVESDSRTPDGWIFTLPAPADAAVQLTQGMAGRIFRLEEGKEPAEVAEVPPARGWKGALAAGRYRLDAVCARVNNRVTYSVAVWPDPLVAGLTREVTAPATIPVAVGHSALVELSSFGSEDVRARLYDSSGRLVSSNDDREDDWNFLIAETLDAGSYELKVDPVGKDSARCAVTMSEPAESAGNALALPFHGRMRPARRVRVCPFTPAGDADMVLVSAASADSVGIAVEVEESGGWKTLASSSGRSIRLESPLPEAGAARMRLRLWSLDLRGNPVDLSLAAVRAARLTESQLARGTQLVPIKGFGPPLAVVAVSLDRPGIFRLEGEPSGFRWSPAAGAACRASESGVLAAPGRTLWIVADLTRRAPTLRAARLSIPASRGQGEPIEVPAGTRAACDLAGREGGPVLVFADSPAGQPGLRIVGRGDSGQVRRDAGMAVAPGRAVAVSLLGGERSAEVWSAGPEETPLSARLRLFRFGSPPAAAPFPGGSWDGALSGLAARAYALPAGAETLRLSFSGEIVGALSRGSELRAVILGADGSGEETLAGDADRLTLFHTRDGEDRYAVQVVLRDPAGAPGNAAPLSPATPYERTLASTGAVRLEVAPRAGTALHVRGASGPPVLVSASGDVRRGTELAPPESGGTLLVPHGPGTLLCWIDSAGASGLWGGAGSGESVAVKPPGSVSLHGRSETLRVAAGGPAMIHLRAAVPSVTRVSRGRGAAEVEGHPAGTLLDVFAADGQAEISLRAVGDGLLWGTAEVDATAVTPIGEGLGPEVLLPPGATRVFSFRVARKGPVGIGVKASSDVVTATLMDAGGSVLDSGVVLMPELPPGDYLLALHAPEDASPVLARPALAGLELPATGPPEEVIRGYREPEAEHAASAGRGPASRIAREPEGGEPAGVAEDVEAAPEASPETLEEEPSPAGEEEAPPPGQAGMGSSDED